jgi:sugar phosphate permease
MGGERRMNREGAEGLSQEAKVEEPPYPSEGYAWYVVIILLIVYVFSFIDRQIFAFLVGPLKEDLLLSDFQISLLMGFSFAVFYTFFGIPMGRLADSRTRRGIIAAGLFVWSLTSAGCGLAKTYAHLLLLRIGVFAADGLLQAEAGGPGNQHLWGGHLHRVGAGVSSGGLCRRIRTGA